jgi:hypothetical protein
MCLSILMQEHYVISPRSSRPASFVSHSKNQPRSSAIANSTSWCFKVDTRFGSDDEQGVGVGVAGVAEFLAGFV